MREAMKIFENLKKAISTQQSAISKTNPEMTGKRASTDRSPIGRNALWFLFATKVSTPGGPHRLREQAEGCKEIGTSVHRDIARHRKR